MTDSIKESLHQGIFQDKYKVFCRGILTGKNLLKKQDFRGEYLTGNSFFLLLDMKPDHQVKLSKYLNTGIIEKSPNVIFERILVVAPNNADDETDAYKDIPHYFTINCEGELLAISEKQMQTIVEI